MRKWIVTVGMIGSLATAGTAGVNGSDNYCQWDNSQPVEVVEVNYAQENEGMSGSKSDIIVEEDELEIDMGEFVVTMDE